MQTSASTHTTAARLKPDIWPKGKPKILLADDHAIITDGLRRLLEPECNVVGIAGDGRELIKLARTLHPDIVVADITMPLLNGIDATQQLLHDLPNTRVIFLTMHADRAYVAEVFDAGASGFVVKHAAPSELWQAINAALAGDRYISPLVGGTGVISGNSWSAIEHSSGSYRLSTRQRQVLQLVAEGHSVKEIAAQLGVTPKTVEFHKYRLMKDLGIDSAARLIQFAIQHGLIA